MVEVAPDDTLRLCLVAAIERSISTNVVCWPADYDRRYGELDHRQRDEIVQRATDSVLAVLADLHLLT